MKKTFSLVVMLLGICYATTVFSQDKRIIQTPNAPISKSPFSQAVISNGFVFVAGQVGRKPNEPNLVEGGVEAECQQIMENIKAILEAAGTSLEWIVNTNIYLTNVDDFAKVNKVYGSYITGNYPARTTVGVSALPGGSKIEITVIATLPDKKGKKKR